MAHQVAQVGARHFVDERCCQRGHVGPAFERARISFFSQLLEKIICQRLRVLVNARLERISAFGAHQCVRILAFWQKQEAGAAAILQAGQRGLKCAPGGIAASLIAIKAKQYAGYDPKQALHVLFAGRGAQRGHGIAQALLGQGNDVHIAFNHDDFVEAAIELARFEQPVQFLSFVEDRCFRGVQVFGFVITEHATAKRNDAATAVANREHYAIAKAVIAFAGFSVLNQ